MAVLRGARVDHLQPHGVEPQRPALLTGLSRGVRAPHGSARQATRDGLRTWRTGTCRLGATQTAAAFSRACRSQSSLDRQGAKKLTQQSSTLNAALLVAAPRSAATQPARTHCDGRAWAPWIQTPRGHPCGRVARWAGVLNRGASPLRHARSRSFATLLRKMWLRVSPWSDAALRASHEDSGSAKARRCKTCNAAHAPWRRLLSGGSGLVMSVLCPAEQHSL